MTEEQRRMAIFEAAARRGGSHWTHGGVIGRLHRVTMQRSLFLALHPMALRRWREISANTPLPKVMM
ncbi:hypothetical protein CJD38_12430 [Stenotrophobium rhamnosiphilum]|uniref:Uncharacterized protein n=1 Tax=Stenotrophobium rhamnosiphilum TaxID=2029166 RepID=A0A2T5MEU7_9GAMM|nr:hypothetical protein CJD38_12430 [Stenotrophobium rhamnosiphilum]